MRKFLIVMFVLLFAMVGAGIASAAEREGAPTPECSDGIDNDGDRHIDFPDDSGCESALDDTEEARPNAPQCHDGIDNDGDGLVDSPADPGCSNRHDNTEDDRPPGGQEELRLLGV